MKITKSCHILTVLLSSKVRSVYCYKRTVSFERIGCKVTHKEQNGHWSMVIQRIWLKIRAFSHPWRNLHHIWLHPIYIRILINFHRWCKFSQIVLSFKCIKKSIWAYICSVTKFPLCCSISKSKFCFKGIVSRDEYLFEGCSVHADCFYNFLFLCW